MGNPRVLCIVGTGAQARSHAQAFNQICHFEEVSFKLHCMPHVTCKRSMVCVPTQVRVWGRNAEHARQCAADIGNGCKMFESLEEACRGADVVVTVTMATEPVLFGKWVKEGAIICCEYNNQVSTPPLLSCHHRSSHVLPMLA